MLPRELPARILLRLHMHSARFVEGIGGLKTSEAYHAKADALVIPEMFFFKLPTPFLEMLVL